MNGAGSFSYMGVITLTTDLGHKDFYQAALKGSIISLMPEVRLVDITHEIPSFNIQRAAFVLRNAYHYFPADTVHIIGINTLYQDDSKYLAMRYNNHYFIGADNGIFSLILGEDEPEEMIEINIMQDLRYLHFPLADILSKSACAIAQGAALSTIGVPVDQTLEKVTLQPIFDKDMIRGNVIYVDSFGNVITNISKDLFNKIQAGRDFTLYFKRNETITKLSWHYNEVYEGEKLCLFGISNFLEIAINQGNASQLLGLHDDDANIIRVEFHNN